MFPEQSFRDIQLYVDGHQAVSYFKYSLSSKEGDTVFRGIDYLEVNSDGKVTLKNSTIKGFSELTRKAFMRAPLRFFSYVLKTAR